MVNVSNILDDGKIADGVAFGVVAGLPMSIFSI